MSPIQSGARGPNAVLRRRPASTSHSYRTSPREREPQCSRRDVRALLRLGVAVLLLLGSASAVRAAARFPVRSERGMVVSSQADATRAGVAMLEAGGNAVDAAVATAFALSVTQPFSTGLGGGAFALVRLADGRVLALDTRETAPAAAHRDMYVAPGVPEYASLRGALAVATPGLVAGLVDLQARHGFGGAERRAALLSGGWRQRQRIAGRTYDEAREGPHLRAMVEIDLGKCPVLDTPLRHVLDDPNDRSAPA